MTKRQMEIIQDNLNASYISYCNNIDYLNGWLYGAVQANNNIMKSIR